MVRVSRAAKPLPSSFPSAFVTLRRLLFSFVALLGLLLRPSSAVAQGGADVIRGRVVGPDEQPLSGAIVTATGAAFAARRRLA